MPKVAIVTGGCGFLGRHVVARLVAEGLRVVVLDDRSTPGTMRPLPGGVEFIESNLAYESMVAPWSRAVIGQEVTEVWHLASPASPQLYKRRRVDTLRLAGETLHRILSWSRANGARVLFASSSEVYGNPQGPTQHESHPSRINPVGERSCYDAAKVYGEAVCAAWAHEQDADVRIARIFNTFGPGQSGADGRLVPSLIRAAIDGTPWILHGTGLQTRTLGFVDDTVDGLFRIMRSGPELCAQPVNVGGIETTSVLNLLDLVGHWVGPVNWTRGDRQDSDDPDRRRPELGLLRSLGWEPRVSLYEGIRRTADWMRAHPDVFLGG